MAWKYGQNLNLLICEGTPKLLSFKQYVMYQPLQSLVAGTQILHIVHICGLARSYLLASSSLPCTNIQIYMAQLRDIHYATTE